jgi:tRNA-Thr(GGU) m(6)t(6)A37 methyltransferase TsaA
LIGMSAPGTYLDELTSRLQARLGDRLVAAWVVGSGALGDFDPAHSDIDVQAVSSDRLARPELEALAAELSHYALPCPVRGLEFVLYARDDLTEPRGPAFSLNLNTGPRMDHHAGYDPDAEPRFWFILDVAIAREHARSLAGPPPASVLPELPRELIAFAHRQALTWWGDNDRGQALLAAARAAAWAETGRWLSKGAAAEALITRVDRSLALLMDLRPIGTVESPLAERSEAPKQGDEGAPEAWLAFDESVAAGLEGIAAGDELLLLTWFDRAARDVLQVHPRGDVSRGMHGVFTTRSPDRPNPIGLHRIRVIAVDGTRVQVADLEALDGTPILDVKPVLGRIDER